MEKAIIIGFASMFAFVAVMIKIALLVYFFILLNRIAKAVERIEQRTGSIEAAVREPGRHDLSATDMGE